MASASFELNADVISEWGSGVCFTHSRWDVFMFGWQEMFLSAFKLAEKALLVEEVSAILKRAKHGTRPVSTCTRSV